MGQYSVLLKDVEGRTFRDVATADSSTALVGRLREKGWTVISVNEVADAGDKSSVRCPLIPLRRASRTELAVFCTQLGTMIDSGLPIMGAVESVASEMARSSFQSALFNVLRHLEEGSTFAQSLKKCPETFSTLLVSMVEAGEASGHLPEILLELAGYLENEDKAVRKIRAATSYPIFVAGFCSLMVAVIIIVLIPKFKTIFAGFGAELPLLTRIVIEASDFMRQYWPLEVVLLAGMSIGLLYWRRSATGQETLDRVKLRLPLIGNIIYMGAMARFCRMLSTLISGGVTVVEALRIVSRTATNSVIRDATLGAQEMITEGFGIAESFRKQRIFADMVVRMTAAGEEAGTIDEMLTKVADFYDQRVDNSIAVVTSLIEPAMIVGLGVVVLVVVLAMYLPIFQMSSVAR